MSKLLWLTPVLALVLGGCGNSQSVDKPAAEVYSMLASLPSDADALSLATRYPGTAYYVEPGNGKLVWHFSRDGTGEYGRYIAEISENGPNKSTVSTHFEDGPADTNLTFLDKVAQIALDASIAAVLQGKPVDRSVVQTEITQAMVSNPVSAQIAAIETVSDEIDRQAPPDSCEEGTEKEQSSWVCEKHGKDINGDTGVITDAETGEVLGHR